MITELRLENWKSFGEATLYIDPLTILIGTNASGKSNVLRVFFFLQRVASGVPFTEALNLLRGGVDWAIQKPHDVFSIKVFLKENETTSYEYYLKCKYENSEYIAEVEALTIFIGEKTMHFPPLKEMENKKQRHLQSILYIAHSMHVPSSNHFLGKYVLESLRNICVLIPNPSLMINYSQLSERINSSATNIAGVLAALSPKRQKEVEDILTQYTSRLPERDIYRVYAEKIGKLGKDAMLYCDEKWADSGEVFTVDARAMSDGTLRFLAILTALLTLPEGSLLAIDEVDNGLHPSRAKLLLEALQTIGKQRNIDVLVTTHNPALLDVMGTDMVPFVTVAHRDPETGDSKLTLLEDIEQLPKLLAQGTVGKLSTQGLLEKSLESVHE